MSIFEKFLRAGEGRMVKRLKAVAEAVNAIEQNYTDLTDAELQAHFAANQETYRSPEKRRVRYLAVDADKLRSKYPDLVLIPIGNHFVMSPREAAYACKMLQVKHVIPMHYGTFPVLTGTPSELRQRLKESNVDTEVLEMKPGQTLG